MMSYSCKWYLAHGASHYKPVQSLKETNRQKHPSTVYNVAVRSSAAGALFYTSAPLDSRCATAML